jgi:hypothetical protein
MCLCGLHLESAELQGKKQKSYEQGIAAQMLTLITFLSVTFVTWAAIC